jgi:hypothetical protein
MFCKTLINAYKTLWIHNPEHHHWLLKPPENPTIQTSYVTSSITDHKKWNVFKCMNFTAKKQMFSARPILRPRSHRIRRIRDKFWIASGKSMYSWKLTKKISLFVHKVSSWNGQHGSKRYCIQYERTLATPFITRERHLVRHFVSTRASRSADAAATFTEASRVLPQSFQPNSLLK